MARQPETEYWTVQELAKRTNTPAPFLAKTFQSLVKHKILTSSKGRRGGFALLRPTRELTILDIVHIIDGPSLAQDCALGFRDCNNEDPCPFHEQWGHIRATLLDALSSETIEEVAKRI